MVALTAVGAEQFWAEGGEELFETAAVLKAAAQDWDHGWGDMHAAAALALGKGEDPGGMFVTTGTGRAVFADAGFFDQRERAFEWRPKGGQLGEELLLECLLRG